MFRYRNSQIRPAVAPSEPDSNNLSRRGVLKSMVLMALTLPGCERRSTSVPKTNLQQSIDHKINLLVRELKQDISKLYDGYNRIGGSTEETAVGERALIYRKVGNFFLNEGSDFKISNYSDQESTEPLRSKLLEYGVYINLHEEKDPNGRYYCSANLFRLGRFEQIQYPERIEIDQIGVKFGSNKIGARAIDEVVLMSYSGIENNRITGVASTIGGTPSSGVKEPFILYNPKVVQSLAVLPGVESQEQARNFIFFNELAHFILETKVQRFEKGVRLRAEVPGGSFLEFTPTELQEAYSDIISVKYTDNVTILLHEHSDGAEPNYLFSRKLLLGAIQSLKEQGLIPTNLAVTSESAVSEWDALIGYIGSSPEIHRLAVKEVQAKYEKTLANIIRGL